MPRRLRLDCPVTSPRLGGLGSDRPVRVRPSLLVLLDSALSMRRPRPHRKVRDGSLCLHTTRTDANSGSGGRQRRKAVWLDPGPDWDEEKVAEFLEMCASTWCARHEAPVILTVDAAAMHVAGHAFYQAANGVWLTDHVPPGDLSGWPG
jgi:hypothetical protein